MGKIVRMNLNGRPFTLVDLALVSSVGVNGSADAEIDIELSMIGSTSMSWAVFESEDKKDAFIREWREFRESHDVLGRPL